MPITLSKYDKVWKAPQPVSQPTPTVETVSPEPDVIPEGYPLCQVGSELAYTPDEVVYLSVRLLAGNDPDFAQTRNDIGFNRLHASFGHQLSEKPLDRWTERDVWSARKMLETYKNTQLKGLVEHMPALSPTPPRSPWQQAQHEESVRRGVGGTQSFTWRKLSLAVINGQQVAVVEQNYDTELIAKIKQLPQRRYDGTNKRWYVPIQLDALEPLIDFALANGYDMPENVQAVIAKTLGDFQDTMNLSRAADTDREFDLPDGLELFPFQKAGVAYAEKVGNVLIADEMGLGKTVQALVTVKEAGQFPVVVICPASLKRNWERETKKWLPGLRVTVLNGTINPLRFMGGDPIYDVVIINYNSQILSKWLPHLVDIAPKAIILDECHAIKNAKAQQSKLVNELIGKTEARIVALSGTPVVNRPMEFFQIVRALGHAKTLGGFAEYKRRYNNESTKALHELNVRARTHFMVRRLKADVLTELPDKMYTTVPLQIINRPQYEKVEGDIASYFAEKKSNDAEFMAEILATADQMGMHGEAREAFIVASKKEQFNQSYLIAAQNEALLRWEALKSLAVQGKLAACMDWIDEFLESSDQKLVVFCSHTEIGKAIAARYGSDFIYGGVDPDKRLPMVDRFQNDPNTRVIVGNLIAMGEGLTLTAASNVAFIEFGWNRKQHAQAEDRCHRIGQHDSVMVWNLVAEGTIEEEILALIEKKRIVSDAIQDGDVDSQAAMLRDLERILEERLASKRA